MSLLATRGHGAAASVGGGGGGSGPSGIVVPFLLYDDDGDLANGVDLTGAVKVSIGGDTFAAAVGDAPTNIGGRTGHYYYVLDESEVPSDGSFVILSVVKTGYQGVCEIKPIGQATTANVTSAKNTILSAISSSITTITSAISSATTSINANVDAVASEVAAALELAHGAGSWVGATSAEMLDAIMSFEFRPGRTPLGFFRRMDALFFNKVTGLLGTVVRTWAPSEAFVEFEATQDPTAGTRAEVDVTTSETP